MKDCVCSIFYSDLEVWGYIIALAGGAVATFIIVEFLRWLGEVDWNEEQNRPKKLFKEKIQFTEWKFWKLQIFTILFGVLERLAIMWIAIFDITYRYELKGVGSFSLAWIGFKLACNWNRPGRFAPRPINELVDEAKKAEGRFTRAARGGLSALIGSLASIVFAIWGAYIYRGVCWPLPD